MRPGTIAVLMVTSLSFAVFGQISLKYGMQRYGPLGTPGLNLAFKLIGAIFTPHVLLGLCLYAAGACSWLVVISPGGWALSYAYPMVAISYVAVVLLSRLFFGEAVTPIQWVGIALMCAGLILVARFGASTSGMR